MAWEYYIRIMVMSLFCFAWIVVWLVFWIQSSLGVAFSAGIGAGVGNDDFIWGAAGFVGLEVRFLFFYFLAVAQGCYWCFIIAYSGSFLLLFATFYRLLFLYRIWSILLFCARRDLFLLNQLSELFGFLEVTQLPFKNIENHLEVPRRINLGFIGTLLLFHLPLLLVLFFKFRKLFDHARNGLKYFAKLWTLDFWLLSFISDFSDLHFGPLGACWRFGLRPFIDASDMESCTLGDIWHFDFSMCPLQVGLAELFALFVAQDSYVGLLDSFRLLDLNLISDLIQSQQRILVEKGQGRVIGWELFEFEIECHLLLLEHFDILIFELRALLDDLCGVSILFQIILIEDALLFHLE